MGDFMGSLVWGSHKQTILCVNGVGCYTWSMMFVSVVANVANFIA
jgi:hypothetical protein